VIRKAAIYILYVMLLVPALCSAQQSRRDSLRLLRDTTRIYYLDNTFFSRYALMQYEREDTSISTFRFFDPAVKKYVINASLGNLGTAVNPALFEFPARPGFDLGMHAYDVYDFTDENTKYYLTLRPLTRLSYFLGMGGEQLLNVTHTQRIIPDLQLGVQYRHINADGFYRRQSAVYHNFRFFGRYNTKNKRYKILVNFIHNEFNVQESGGLVNDTDFVEDVQTTNPSIRKVYLVNLDSASNRWYNNQFTIQHAYTFDRAKKDTVNFDERPLFTLMHRLHYNNRENRYRDSGPNTGYYPNVYYDTSYTHHSLRYQTVDNEFKALLYLRKKFRSHSPFMAGIRHQYVDVQNLVGRFQGDTLELDSAYIAHGYHNLSLMSSFRFDITEQLFFDAMGWYYLAGYNQNDFQLSFSVSYFSKDSAKTHHQLSAFVHYLQSEAPYVAENFVSNHYQWSNSFQKQRVMNTGLSYVVPEWNMDIQFNAYLLNNYIYYDTVGTPRQFADVNSVFTLALHKRFRAWKFYFDNYFIGQYSSSDVVRVPYFMGRFSFYFQGYLFKKALLLNTGFDISYNTPYKAYAYDPATSQFRLQDEYTTGNYPYLDVFLTAKIKSVTAYVRLRNTNQRWPDVPYFLTPHHPMQDRTVQFGLTWDFLN